MRVKFYFFSQTNRDVQKNENITVQSIATYVFRRITLEINMKQKSSFEFFYACISQNHFTYFLLQRNMNAAVILDYV